MMRQVLFAAVSLAGVMAQSNMTAPYVTNNTAGELYTLGLTYGGNSSISGSFQIAAAGNDGVSVAVSISGFDPSVSQLYTYHIHEYPVPADGNCSRTGDHFDPYHVGSSYVCPPTQPTTCQIGDLSGKHGGVNLTQINGTAFTAAYTDLFLSTTPGNIAFFGDKSVVIHRKSDNKRLKCGNFVRAAAGAGAANATYTNSTTTMSRTSTAMMSSTGSMTSGGSMTIAPVPGTQTTSSSPSTATQSSPIATIQSGQAWTSSVNPALLTIIIASIGLVMIV